MVQYAIKVPLLGLDEDWTYVTTYCRELSEFKIETYQTRDEALLAAKIWKKAKVVEYRPKKS